MFKQIDKNENGYITKQDFRDFFKSLNLFPIEKELQILFDRLDKD